MNYPPVIDLNLVGEYDEAAYSGGGYFFDHVLEYRVWCYQNDNVESLDNDNTESMSAHSHGNDNIDCYHAFATYEDALAFANSNQNAQAPLALVQQFEWVDQPSRGIYIHNKGERITEWQVEWLDRGSRQEHDISDFLRQKAK